MQKQVECAGMAADLIQKVGHHFRQTPLDQRIGDAVQHVACQSADFFDQLCHSPRDPVELSQVARIQLGAAPQHATRTR